MAEHVSFGSLAVVMAVAFAAPLALGLVPRLRIPAVVLEIVLGIIVGPDVLGWAEADDPVQILALVGLAFLLFLAGLELDLDQLRGRLLRVAATGFVVVVAVVVIALTRHSRSMAISKALARLQDTTAQIRVRGAMLLLVLLVVAAEQFGLEAILGAFVAGAVISVIDRDATRTHPQFRVKLEAIGYGFLIPVFFVASGIRFDLSALLDDPSTLARVPIFLAALLLVRGVPALVYRPLVGGRGAGAAGLLQATSLPFIVAATEIGIALDLVTPATAAAFVAAGLVSALVFPTAAAGLLRRDRDVSEVEITNSRGARTWT